MKRISSFIEYHTQPGEYLICEEGKMEKGKWMTESSSPMTYNSGAIWSALIEVPSNKNSIQFKFLLKRDNQILRKEYGTPHLIYLPENDCSINCCWQDKPRQRYLNSSFFYNSIFKHEYRRIKHWSAGVQIILNCIHVEQSQEVVLCGDGDFSGNWDVTKGVPLIPIAYGKWALNLTSDQYKLLSQYKFAIRDKHQRQLIEWEDEDNRTFSRDIPSDHSFITEINYRKESIQWRGSGLVIPIFSLRTEQSFGIGEFPDMKLLIDWAAKTNMKVIQTLPINDTTATYTWLDSYPYNGISTYALHPIYLGLSSFTLKDKKKQKKYTAESKKLNQLKTIDYDRVIRLKTDFQKDLYNEIGEEALNSTEFKTFFSVNKEWLFPYACFCHLRDKYKTSKFSAWEEFSVYNKALLEIRMPKDKLLEKEIRRVYFIQFLLHKQLTEIKEYAYAKGVTLKGDIPIGISPNSVEAWTEPHLFNMDCQTGAPPDDFSVDGQNWGFPTYNWKAMAEDGYLWWKRRFSKMADYFDAYRIDHILGFFRIWEIPQTSVNGLLGYFSPALPLNAEEIHRSGFSFDEKTDITPSIHKDDLKLIFGKYSDEAVNKYLSYVGNDLFILDKKVDTQKKIQSTFGQMPDNDKNQQIRNGLYKISCEVLFLRDKYEATRFHPRISLQNTLRFKRLDDIQKNSLIRLYQDYFYQRHTEFWRQEAMKKLPALISATDMLVCGEDLGMVPDSVHSVMEELEILSLEIQRMPKQLGLKFSFLEQTPYLSVVTTSTHDMSPIRMWWKEDKELTKEYFETRLHMQGDIPKECNTMISMEILKAHLHSPAMLTIFPFQDWLAVSDKLKRDNEDEERINIPSDPKHNWNYRIHLTLEELLKEDEFAELIRLMNQESGR